MTSFKETAQAYEPKRTLNIADLDRFDISTPLENRSGTNKEGESYTSKVAVINDIEYRVPNSVLEETQKMLNLKSDIQFINVERTGSGLATKYTVSVVD